MAQIRVIFITIEETNGGQCLPPKAFASNTTLQEAACSSGIDTKQKIFKFNQSTINDPNKTLESIKKEQNVQQPILPIRIFKKAVGGQQYKLID